jgi:hypothetical protein
MDHLFDTVCCAADLPCANPYNVTHGTDFVKECASPHLDFASIHMYADQWCQGAGDEQCSRCDKSVCNAIVHWLAASDCCVHQHLTHYLLVSQQIMSAVSAPLELP